MKIKKYLISAMAIFLMGSMVACQSKPAENKKAEEKKEEKKEEKQVEKASEEEKAATIKALEEQKKIELEIPNLKDSDKQSIENKYANLISSVKEDKMGKEDVLKLKDAAENYVNNVKESRGEKVEKKEEKK
ncbi:hypothetical protein [uncultured Parvimonas sp.]|mgnify:CR=1 FL=1|jgi:hypothetical protein|uniref:hypothetical protein n=2 Tax=Parvimonas TaxID=543311 RepID=UPI0028D6DC6E|nr:hypothetical protein [uncultured Parvimonas sp.]